MMVSGGKMKSEDHASMKTARDVGNRAVDARNLRFAERQRSYIAALDS